MNTAHTFHHPASRLPTFRTSPPDWTKFVCVEPSGGLAYVNGDLVPKFCSVCPGMLKHRKCLRSTTIEDRAERFLAFVADRAAMKKLTRSNRENVNRVARWLKRTFKKCVNCSHIARVGLKTCRACGIAGNEYSRQRRAQQVRRASRRNR